MPVSRCGSNLCKKQLIGILKSNSYTKKVHWTGFSCYFSRGASSKVQKLDDLDENDVADDFKQPINIKLNKGFSLYHKHSSTLVHFREDFIHAKTSDLNNDEIDYPKWLTPEKLKQIQLVLDHDKKEESPAHSIDATEDLRWLKQEVDTSRLLKHYLMLSKVRLTGLVVLTSMAGYAMAPGIFDPVTFLLASTGTALTSASANATNQFLEVPYDSQMNRTKNRVLVRGYLTPNHALAFAAGTGVFGLVILYLGANPLTAGLGAFNWMLYTMFYTPMKRMTIMNTWMGSIVGAIPPMMGWAAVTGGLEPGAWLLAAIMYAWQFPHFNALSWNLRPDYSRGGYRMMSVIDPDLCKRVAMRYSVGMIGLCFLAPLLDMTTWMFALDSLPLNGYFAYLGWRFYRDGDSNSSRKLFRFSLIHIPALFILMIISKNYQEDFETKREEARLLKKRIKEQIMNMTLL